MREYPKVCPKCGRDMEPIFVEGSERSTSSNPLTLANEIDPAYWKCANFECENYGKKCEVEE